MRLRIGVVQSASCVVFLEIDIIGSCLDMVSPATNLAHNSVVGVLDRVSCGRRPLPSMAMLPALFILVCFSDLHVEADVERKHRQ